MGSNVENKRSVIGLFIQNKGDKEQIENCLLLSRSNNDRKLYQNLTPKDRQDSIPSISIVESQSPLLQNETILLHQQASEPVSIKEKL